MTTIDTPSPSLPVCPLDSGANTIRHHVLAANGDLLAADRYRKELGSWVSEDTDALHGAILHALDELDLLATQLGISGFRHPDHCICEHECEGHEA